MTEAFAQDMGFDPDCLHLTIPAGEAVARWLKREHPQNTAKLVARKAGMDPRSVENILEGHLSGPNLTRLLRAYGWSLLATVGAAVIGETYENSLHRELEDIAHERRGLEEREERLRGSWARLRARRSVDGDRLRLVHPEDADAGGQVRGLG